MREIKFRAWDILYSRMMYDGFSVSASGDPVGYFVEPDRTPNTTRICGEWRGDSTIVPMQYTGLKDKNGKEIYEGDVVKIPRFDNPKLLFDGKKYDVAFIDGCFELYDSGGGYACDLKQVYSISEVIGNIYENPELLETK